MLKDPRAQALQKVIREKRKAEGLAPRLQCPQCGDWWAPKDFSLSKDLCVSCIEDMETEDMEEWIRADYYSSRGV